MRTKGWKLPDLLLQLFGTSHTTLFNEESESKKEKMILKVFRVKATKKCCYIYMRISSEVAS